MKTKKNSTFITIYKSYYISEQKTKYIDVHKIFAIEYIKRINENKTLQKCTFLMKVKNNIISAKYGDKIFFSNFY
jgi:hypothetical protein